MHAMATEQIEQTVLVFWHLFFLTLLQSNNKSFIQETCSVTTTQKTADYTKQQNY